MSSANLLWLLACSYFTLVPQAISQKKVTVGNGTFLINTTGCKIPTVNIVYPDAPQKKVCQNRYIYIFETYNKTLKFYMEKDFDYCCYEFISLTKTNKLRYSKCEVFKNNTEIMFRKEFITLRCTYPAYEDYYGFVKKFDGTIKGHSSKSSWNVLLLGIDNMSRFRAHKSLVKTTQFLQRNKWLDFRGYNKVAINKSPNLKAVLTGKSTDNWRKLDQRCFKDMSACNNFTIWHAFKSAGYATAFGEDSTAGIFQNEHYFRDPPTHHYMKPFIKAGRSGVKTKNGLVCMGGLTSAQHILNYILDFSDTYKYNKFFGLFWLSTFSPDVGQQPKQLDSQLLDFFEDLTETGFLQNTFVIFLSAHGIKYGPVRSHIESHYDERLPMLFMWVPKTFRRYHRGEYLNLIRNQGRLISPYDLHLTLWDMLKISSRAKSSSRATECPGCMSAFKKIPKTRSCANAAIPEQWCPCHIITKTSLGSQKAIYSLIQVSNLVSNFHRIIQTRPCTVCDTMRIKKVLRVHYYLADEKNISSIIYYVIAIITEPKNISFDVTVSKGWVNYADSYKVVSLQRVSPLDSKFHDPNHCAIFQKDRFICTCKFIQKCIMVRKRKKIPKHFRHLQNYLNLS